MYSDILIPLDGSNFAEEALPHAITLAKVFNARTTLLYVMEPMAMFLEPTASGPMMSVPFDIEEQTKKAEEYLARTVGDLKNAGIEARPVLKEGDPASNIVDYANESGKDLIVMSTHGRSGIGRWVFGSVADRVLREAHCPVLLIRSKCDPQKDVCL